MSTETLGNITGSGTVARDGKLGSGRCGMAEHFVGKTSNSGR